MSILGLIQLILNQLLLIVLMRVFQLYLTMKHSCKVSLRMENRNEYSDFLVPYNKYMS